MQELIAPPVFVTNTLLSAVPTVPRIDCTGYVIEGLESLIVKVMSLESDPPLFTPVTVNTLALSVTVGVPVMIQPEEISRPEGRAGLVEQLTNAPPLFDGVIPDTNTPFFRV
jgi:hypothetical protein